jgi:hypothetical protein
MIASYTCQTMTGRMCDEMIVEARMLERVLGNYNIRCLNPVLAEMAFIPNEHVTLPHVPTDILEKFWKMDKVMIKEADVIIDYKTHNKSDGSNNEIGYNRWCLWKPTVRVWDGPGALISRMEHDIIVPTLNDAIDVINERFGTYDKLGAWRTEMLERSFPKWIEYQRSLQTRYGMEDVICRLLNQNAEI